MRRIIIISLCSVLLSCGGRGVFRGEFRRMEAGDPVAVRCEVVPCEILGAVDGFVADSLYVCYTMRHPKHRIVICDRRTMSPVTAVALVGNGAGEYGFITPYRRIFKEHDGIKMWILAADKETASKLNLTACCREKRTVIDTTILLREHKLASDGELKGNVVVFDVLNDSLALCESVLSNGAQRRVIYDYRNRRTVHDYDDLYTPVRRPMLNGGITTVDEGLSRVVTVMPVFDQINVCDIDGGNAFAVSDRKRPVSASDLEGMDDMALMERMTGAGLRPAGVAVTDERIVVHYLDRQGGVSELRILDWNGRLLHTLRPDRAFVNISVSDEGMLYGFVSDTMICRVDISGCL